MDTAKDVSNIQEEEPLLGKREINDRMTTWRRFLIGPILSVYMLGYMMSYYTLIEYTNKSWLNKIFHEANRTYSHSSNSTCDINKNDPVYQLETKATEKASQYLVYYSLAQGVPAVFSNLILGSYTDGLGRKFLLAIGISGTAIRLFLSVGIIYFDMNLLYFIGACLVEGVTGQYATMTQVSFAYVSDITEPGKQRTIGLALMMVCLGMSLTVASFAVGLLIECCGYYVPFAMSVVCLICCLFVVFLVLPETLPKHKRVKIKSVKNALANSFSFFVSNDLGHFKWRYRLLFAAHAFSDFSFLGRIGVETIYQMAAPFCWSAQKVGIYGAVRTASMMTIGLASIQLFKKCQVSDIGVAIVGCLSYAAGFYLSAVAINDTYLYIVIVVGMFGPLQATMTRSIASSMTDAKQQGALFSALSAVEIVTNLLSNVGTSGIYSLTVGFMRGFVFLVLGSFDAIAAILLGILLCIWKKNSGQIVTKI